VPDASELFEPLENAIRSQLIPALIEREVSDAKRKILALSLRHSELGLTDPQETTKTEYEHSTQIANKLTAKIYTQKLDLDYNPSDQQFTTHTKTEYDKRKMQKHLWWTFGENDPWITTTHKRSIGKRGIFLAVSLANQSDWICTKHTRIQWWHLHEIWIEGERHTHPLYLWRNKLCGSQPHM